MKFRADRFRELRSRDSLTQRDAAAKLKVAKKTVSEWENSHTEPRLETLVDMASLFHVSVDYLLGLTDELQAAKSELTPLQQKVVDAIARGDISAFSTLLAQFIAKNAKK